jgi:8-oxo-dGTP diphosphatase
MRTTIIVAGVIVEGARVLVRRPRPGHLPVVEWQFPGGKVEDGEDPRVALHRHLSAADFSVAVGDPVHTAFHRDGAKANLVLAYEALRTSTGRTPPPADPLGFTWITAEDLEFAELGAPATGLVQRVSARLINATWST